MVYSESETVELKSKMTNDIVKGIIAFANSEGGTLYIGVDDQGEVVGLDDPDAVALQISNSVRDSVKPDVTMFLHYKTTEREGKKIVEVQVQRGVDRPYYLAQKGMRPEGVYVRQGYSSVPASDSMIRSMIKETDGDRFETIRSLEQNLTFEATKKEFEFRNVEFGSPQMRTLKLMDWDGLYTNLALLLSDQNPYTIKAAIFQGTDCLVFKDRRDFRGSILEQMNEVYRYLDLCNAIHATMEGMTRIDTRDYPEAAVREALLNLLVHRDYSFSASSFIRVYDDRMEFVSIGGLLPGVELEDILSGLSVCRNENLANVFYRLHLIETYGTGLSKIRNAYADTSLKPLISTTKNSFKIVLPNMNAKHEKEEGFEPKQNDQAVSTQEYDENKARVLAYVREHNLITRPQAEKLLGVSPSTAYRLINQMVRSGLLSQNGRARNVKYFRAEK